MEYTELLPFLPVSGDAAKYLLDNVVPAIRSGAGDLNVFPTKVDCHFLISSVLGFGSRGGAAGVAPVRSCWKLPWLQVGPAAGQG